MKAYAIAAETIKDQAMFDTYRKEVPVVLLNPPQDFTSCRAGARPGHPINGNG
jgi:hypothetical protein